MKSGCLLSLIIVTFLAGGALTGLAAYQYFPASDYFLNTTPGTQALPWWLYGVVVALAAGCVLMAGSIMGFVYNCCEGCDWFRILVGIVLIIGAALAVPAAVLLGLTLNTFVNGNTGTCYIGYCRLEYFTGAMVALSGLGFLFGICCALTAMMTT